MRRIADKDPPGRGEMKNDDQTLMRELLNGRHGQNATETAQRIPKEL